MSIIPEPIPADPKIVTVIAALILSGVVAIVVVAVFAPATLTVTIVAVGATLGTAIPKLFDRIELKRIHAALNGQQTILNAAIGRDVAAKVFDAAIKVDPASPRAVEAGKAEVKAITDASEKERADALAASGVELVKPPVVP